MSGKIERLPQYTERKRGKNIKTNPRHFSRSMRWAMAALMYALTLSPTRSAADCITSFCPLGTLTFISSYALAFHFSLALCLALDIAVLSTPIFNSILMYYSIACVLRPVYKMHKCTQCIFVQYPMLTNTLYPVHHISTGKTNTHRAQQGGRK